MKQFFVFSVLYLCVSILITIIWREDAFLALQSAWVIVINSATPVLQLSVFLMLISLLHSTTLKSRNSRDVVLSALLAFAGTLLFLAAFGLIKTTQPDIIPFYADPFFARIDKWLHGGIDPWVFTHRYWTILPTDWVSTFYLNVWMYPSALLPIFVAAFDTDVARVRRVMTMYIAAWLIVGNVFALGGMSVGPVFYDRLLGVARFESLTEALLISGVTQSPIGLVQAHLWENYLAHGQSLSTGISAFPSVHVSVACVTAIYLAECSKFLWPIGVAYLISILFLSIYSGYHYAIDGYVSILIVFLIWRWTKASNLLRYSA